MIEGLTAPHCRDFAPIDQHPPAKSQSRSATTASCNSITNCCTSHDTEVYIQQQGFTSLYYYLELVYFSFTSVLLQFYFSFTSVLLQFYYRWVVLQPAVVLVMWLIPSRFGVTGRDTGTASSVAVGWRFSRRDALFRMGAMFGIRDGRIGALFPKSVLIPPC
jgi:hypothetical protein